MVLVAGWCGLRFGELVALRRRHVDLLHRTIASRVPSSSSPATSSAGRRRRPAAGRGASSIPDPLVPVLEAHLDQFAEPGPDGYVFVGPQGGLPTSANFGKLWRKARDEVGVTASFHDLRHVAGTLAAQTGATTREVQRRLGHASPDAAHRYQHAAERREKELADRLAAMMPEGWTRAPIAQTTSSAARHRHLAGISSRRLAASQADSAGSIPVTRSDRTWSLSWPDSSRWRSWSPNRRAWHDGARQSPVWTSDRCKLKDVSGQPSGGDGPDPRSLTCVEGDGQSTPVRFDLLPAEVQRHIRRIMRERRRAALRAHLEGRRLQASELVEPHTTHRPAA